MNRKLFLLAILPVMLVGCSSDGEEKEILPVEAQDIKMSSDFIQVEKGKNVAISAIVMPENAICKDVIWTSSDYTIADFIDGGVVGFSKGQCSIFASTKDGKIKKECKVEVTPVKISSIDLGGNERKIFEGRPYKIGYEIYPSDAENKNVIISSSDPNVVTVDPDGITLHAKIVGKAVITLKAEEGDCVAYCDVNVVDVASMMSFIYNSSIPELYGYVTGSFFLTAINEIDENVEMTRFEIIDSKTQAVVFYIDDASKLGLIKPHWGNGLDLDITLTHVYKPIMVWYLKYHNKEYKGSGLLNPFTSC